MRLSSRMCRSQPWTLPTWQMGRTHAITARRRTPHCSAGAAAALAPAPAYRLQDAGACQPPGAAGRRCGATCRRAYTAQMEFLIVNKKHPRDS